MQSHDVVNAYKPKHVMKKECWRTENSTGKNFQKDKQNPERNMRALASVQVARRC